MSCTWIAKTPIAQSLYISDMRRLARPDVKQNIDLLRGGVGNAFGRHPISIIAIFLHELADILKCAVKFVCGIQFTELKLGGVYNLIVAGMAGSTFHIYRSHKKIEPK